MKFQFIGAVVVAALSACAFSSTSHAATIDTTGSDIGTIFNFGYNDTATYGQTFQAGGSQLDSFSLYLRDRYAGSGTLDVRGYIGDWDGSKASNILYESSTQTMNAAGALQTFSFSPNISVASGNTYVAFLSVSNLGVQGFNQFAMPYGLDQIPGAFVYLNNSIIPSQWTTVTWSQDYVGNNDVWFQASFNETSATPLPAAFPLFATGLGVMGLLGWRRKRKSALAAA